MSLILSEINIYPIKSLGGISLSESKVTDRGLQFDRRWMLVDGNNKFLTQRQLPEMALLKVSLKPNGLLIEHSKKLIQLFVPFFSNHEIATRKALRVEIWEDFCQAIEVNIECNQFFSQILNRDCKLVYMPDESRRMVDASYAFNNELTSFSDGFPILLIGEESLNELNSRLEEKLPMNRFRPNFVFSGGQAFEEDGWKNFKINNIDFICPKPCARCVVTSTDQQTAIVGKEPLKTLATYRKEGNKILFGQNVLNQGTGLVKVGEYISVIK